MTDDKPETYLKKYKEIFERAFQSEELKKLLIHEGNDIGFASPLKTGRVDMQKDILFVGINPSYRKKDIGKYPLTNSLEGGNNDYFAFNYDLEEYYSETDKSSDVYFGKIVEVAQQSNLDLKKCGYLDLFVYRKTDQNSVMKILNAPNGVDFIISQIEVFHEIVSNLIKPKLIVILNAQAQGFLGLRSHQKKGSVEKENVWLGLEISRTNIPKIYSISGLNPKLSPSFNARISSSFVQDEMHILPFKYLRYISKNEINDLVAALKEFNNIYLR